MTESQLVVPVMDRSQVGDARRVASRLAERLGFSEPDRGRVALAATEIATNLIRHGGGGDLLIGPGCDGAPPAAKPPPNALLTVDLLGLDRGQGMSDVSRCMKDGYSSAGSPGTGLGAVRRLARHFDIYSQPKSGTMIFARLAQGEPARGVTAPALRCGAVSRPVAGETACGDTWRFVQEPGRAAVLLADGLGHGPLAAEAANAAAAVFQRDPFAPPLRLIELSHAALRGGRGAAVAIAQFDAARALWRYCAVGNIAGTVIRADDRQGMFSHNGTVGVEMRHTRELEYPAPKHAILVMHSDGLSARWDLDDYPALRQCHPAVIAGVLYRDFARARDDATVVVVA